MAKVYSFLCALLMLIQMSSCHTEKKADESASASVQSVRTESFGTMPDGKPVNVHTLRNANGVEMRVINYGGIVTALKVPDRNGDLGDIVLGFDSLSQYISNNPYFGALIGRYGNRIANGKFAIDGQQFALPQNDGQNHLHGGIKGFDKVWWDISVPDSAKSTLKLTYASVDGEQGYPGNLQVEVFYHLTDSNEWRIDYKAVTDKKTIINLTQHAYFNLAGEKSKDILSHSLLIDADHFLPVDKTLIPVGKLQPVGGTPFDFKKPEVIGARIDANNEQLKLGRGYDHCWALNGYDGRTLRKVAVLSDSLSGRLLEVHTTEPGLQFYSGNFLDGTLTGKNGVVYEYRSGLCLETQHYPDSPNQKEFPTVVLNPGEAYQTSTVYKFTVAK